MRSQRRKKERAVQAFGGCCQRCGYDKCLDALEFHHLDASTKAQSPSYVVMRWSWERAKVELEKCVLLCANCHREAEHKVIPPEELILPRRPWVTKTCYHCGTSFDTKDVEQKYCSASCVWIGRRKTERPSKDDLVKLLTEHSCAKIGRMFGVSDNAVRKWAKRYHIV